MLAFWFCWFHLQLLCFLRENSIIIWSTLNKSTHLSVKTSLLNEWKWCHYYFLKVYILLFNSVARLFWSIRNFYRNFELFLEKNHHFKCPALNLSKNPRVWSFLSLPLKINWRSEWQDSYTFVLTYLVWFKI